MYTDFDHFFTVTTKNVRRIKVKLCRPPHLYSVTTLPSKTHTAAHITCCIFIISVTLQNVAKQISAHSIVTYLYSQQYFVTTL